jgi:DivIVA domain-containing protein
MTERDDTEVTTMALLTADDVLNKKFQPTKFREGYDQDEVDDFLDEVVNTLRVVTGENEELKAKLAAAERRVAELTREGGNGARPAFAEAQSPAESEPEVVEQAAARPVPAAAPVQPAPVQAAPVQAAPVQTAQAGGNEPESATGMLALAQRLHDEYVRNGKEEGERLVSEAQAEGQRIIKEAEDQHNRTLTQLEQERSLLERKIDELRTFERDYRTRLKSYLESLLSNVESGAPKAEGI